MPTTKRIAALALSSACFLTVAACGADPADSQSSPAPASGGQSGSSGTFDEWRDAVCLPGDYFPGSNFPGTTDGGSCLPRSSRGTVYLTEWPSEFDLQNAMSRFHMTYYVAVSDNGAPTAFSVNFNAQGSGALEPLTAFGFTITRV